MHRSLVAALLALLLSVPALAQDPARRPPQESNSEPIAEAAETPDVDAVVAGLKSDTDGDRIVALDQALAVTDDAVTKPLIRLLINDRFDIRAGAIRALGARDSEKSKKEAAKALCVRLPKLAKSAIDEGELVLVVEALHELAQPSSIKPLLDKIVDSQSDDVFRARVMAVANVPDAEAIDELIQLLARRGRGKWAGQKRSVINALQSATGEKLGGDPDEWRSWWKDAKKSFDFEAAAADRREGEQREAEREERKRERGERRGKKKDSKK